MVTLYAAIIHIEIWCTKRQNDAAEASKKANYINFLKKNVETVEKNILGRLGVV